MKGRCVGLVWLNAHVNGVGVVDCHVSGVGGSCKLQGWMLACGRDTSPCVTLYSLHICSKWVSFQRECNGFTKHNYNGFT